MIRLEEDKNFPVTSLCNEILPKSLIKTYGLFTLRMNTVYGEVITSIFNIN